uniref:Signal recognition particle 14 kDa protein n=1 Tax=Arcella intermedia TaxID=1963864 RepID=A0A6B2LPZ7_9EUKA
MPHLENGPFLKQLKSLFENSQSVGTVYVTFKGVYTEPKPKKRTEVKKAEEGEPKKVPEKKNPPEKKVPTGTGEYRCLVRATNGKSGRHKVKISTHVKTKDLMSFQLAYDKLLTSSMDALKKREKEKKKKKTKHA